MCTGGDQVPGSIAEALHMAHAGMDYLNSPAAAELHAASAGPVLAALGELQAKATAAHAGFLRRFDAADAHDADGYGTSAAWLAAKAQLSVKDAKAAVRRMRQLTEHRHIADALAAGQISASWAKEICGWSERLPEGMREDADQILAAAAAGGAELADLAGLAQQMYERAWAGRADDDDDGFDDRRLTLDLTFAGAGRLTGDLTSGCSAALAAVLEALGKPAGPEDLRTVTQRRHDALAEACRRLIASGMLPGRAGQPTQVLVHMGLGQLRDLPGASDAEAAWTAGRAHQQSWLRGAEAAAAACDASLVPIVTGHADPAALDRLTEAFPGGEALSRGSRLRLRNALLALAADALSGPGGLAARLRAGPMTTMTGSMTGG